MDVALSVLVLVAPLALLPIAIGQSHVARHVAIKVCLAASILGEASLLLWLLDVRLASLATSHFWVAATLYFPLTVIPLGLSAACVGAAGTRLLEHSVNTGRIALSRSLPYYASVGGAVVGLAFMIAYESLASLVTENEWLSNALPFGLAGAIAGAGSGWIVGRSAVARTR